jgi:simple sugar transport system permease protein
MIKRLFRHHEAYVLLVIVAMSMIITSINPKFLTFENMFDLLKSYSFIGIFAIGVTFVLISGGIDISFTAVATVAEYTMAVIIINFGGNIFVAFLLASAVGIVLGLVNASLIYFFKIPTIITTIATLNIFYGVLTVISGGKWIYALPEWFRKFADIRLLSLQNAEGIEYGLSIITGIWIVIIIISWLILRYTKLGRGIYAMGGSINAAKRAGFNIFRIQMFVYSFMGLMAGIAGMVQALLVQTVAPNSIVGKELDVLAAVVLGGASLAGGTGTIFGTLLGVTLIAILSNGMTLMRVSSFWYNFFIGLVILISVSFSAYRRRMRLKRAITVEVK